MPWSHPAPRMREFVLAIRAIWACWNDGTQARLPRRLLPAHADDAVLQPRPEPATAPPKVFLAAVGELMTEVAGEVCDGILCHGFTTERYLREVTLPALERGLAARPGKHAGRLRDLRPGVRRHRHQRGGDGEGRARARTQQIAFYGSTPAYRGGARAPRLGRPADRAQPAVEGRASGWRWASSSTTRSSTRSPSSASPRRSPPELSDRYGDVVDRLSFYAPYKAEPDTWLPVIEQAKAS